MIFNESVKFIGKYRPYQQRVLDNITGFLDNEKIHIVAAPGSGKTILGLELIKRLDNVSLVLVPSIALREQWIDRFANGFLQNKEDVNKYISNDIKNFKPIICITYQAFYSAYQREINKESFDEDEEEFESIDFNEFDLLDTLIKYNVKTFCLDECHHLKNEWWKALENVINKIDDHKIIALTATPPYDSNNTDWQRYINLCGPIDEEILVPELINDNNLCPHQDYVYFSFPTEKEEKTILKSYGNGLKIYDKYKNNQDLLNLVLTNNIYLKKDKFKKVYYDNEDYYSSLLLYLKENNIALPHYAKSLINNKKLDIVSFETLLQNVLFDDQYSYNNSTLITSMKKEFSALGVVNKRKVCISHNDKINKIITMSTSKLNSIETIVSSEVNNNKDMKCLILTDYIKMSSKNYIGNLNKEIDSFGTLPIFEYLRRANIADVKLCCLSGSICIVPKSCVKYLQDDFNYEVLADENYVEILTDYKNRKKIVLLITKLFENNEFNVLIGTKSLLGEGWDSPCVDTLIMASFIGSYVSSNQMRGRAIRTYKNNINKISNVWHLVTLNPFDCKYSFDYYKLEKRFSTFVGVDLKRKVIESGIERLGLHKVPNNKKEASYYNEESLLISHNKYLIKNTWNECINNCEKIDSLTKLTIIPRKRLKKEFSFLSNVIVVLLSIVLLGVNDNFSLAIQGNTYESTLNIIYLIIKILFILLGLSSIIKCIYLINSKAKLLSLGRATLRALIKSNQVHSKKAKVIVKQYNEKKICIYLLNATTHEQNLFSDCIIQTLAPIDQPRYLICKPKYSFLKEYYVVPNAFKKNKELVKLFTKELFYVFGLFYIVFAKNDSGKLEAIKADKIYQMKFKNGEITSKNILLNKTRRKKL